MVIIKDRFSAWTLVVFKRERLKHDNTKMELINGR